MSDLPSFDNLVLEFGKLPGIGPRSAERMAYAVLNMGEEGIGRFAEALLKAKTNITRCPKCGLYTEGGVCGICDDPERDHSVICVVATVKDALSIEKMKGFKGVYHVLGGLINASKGVDVDSLAIDSLLKKADQGDIKEVILALSATLEGETTALFLAKLLEKKGITATRLGYGLPMGASLDYADSLTLEKAFEGRRKI